MKAFKKRKINDSKKVKFTVREVRTKSKRKIRPRKIKESKIKRGKIKRVKPKKQKRNRMNNREDLIEVRIAGIKLSPKAIENADELEKRMNNGKLIGWC